MEREEQRSRLSEVQKAFNSLALEAHSNGVDVTDLLRSPVEIQCDLALGKFYFAFQNNKVKLALGQDYRGNPSTTR